MTMLSSCGETLQYVCLHSSAAATAARQSLREEQERKTEAERQGQPLWERVFGHGELLASFPGSPPSARLPYDL